jgi:hypothetical protein
MVTSPHDPNPLNLDVIFAESAEREADLVFLESLRWFKKEFFDRVCFESQSRDEPVLATLRTEATYRLAEFLYLLRARKIETADDIRSLADRHNQYIVDLLKDGPKLAQLRLTRKRLHGNMFTRDTKPRLVEHWREHPGAIDQSNLARFQFEDMSDETCRKVVVACAEAGYLNREETPYGTILISSNGSLERIFRDCLREQRDPLCASSKADCDLFERMKSGRKAVQGALEGEIGIGRFGSDGNSSRTTGGRKKPKADIVLLKSLMWFKLEFFDRVCSESQNKEERVLATLRLDATYRLAEFLSLLRARRIETEDDIRSLAAQHNQYIIDLSKDGPRMAHLGLTPERLLDNRFTADTMPRLVQLLSSTGSLERILGACLREIFEACLRSCGGASNKEPDPVS